MGTRGLLGFIIKGKKRGLFHRYDSYPKGLGAAIMRFVLLLNEERMEEMARRLQAIRWVDDDEEIPDDDEGNATYARLLALRADFDADRTIDDLAVGTQHGEEALLAAIEGEVRKNGIDVDNVPLMVRRGWGSAYVSPAARALPNMHNMGIVNPYAKEMRPNASPWEDEREPNWTWGACTAGATDKYALALIFSGELTTLVDSASFATDGVFCEYAYWLDFEARTLETSFHFKGDEQQRTKWTFSEMGEHPIWYGLAWEYLAIRRKHTLCALAMHHGRDALTAEEMELMRRAELVLRLPARGSETAGKGPWAEKGLVAEAGVGAGAGEHVGGHAGDEQLEIVAEGAGEAASVAAGDLNQDGVRLDKAESAPSKEAVPTPTPDQQERRQSPGIGVYRLDEIRSRDAPRFLPSHSAEDRQQLIEVLLWAGIEPSGRGGDGDDLWVEMKCAPRSAYPVLCERITVPRAFTVEFLSADGSVIEKRRIESSTADAPPGGNEHVAAEA